MSKLYFYFLFKTTAPDKSAFFGIHRSENPSWGSDGQPINYIGNGPKLIAKCRQYGIQSMVTDVLYTSGDYNDVAAKLRQILTPATLADPLCLNMPQPETNAKISEALTGQPKSPEHKQAIAIALAGNQNPLGNVQSEEHKEAISEARTGARLKWWHKKDTGEEVQMPADEEGLTGFELGRLPKEFKKNYKAKDPKPMSDALRAKLAND